VTVDRTVSSAKWLAHFAGLIWATRSLAGRPARLRAHLLDLVGCESNCFRSTFVSERPVFSPARDGLVSARPAPVCAYAVSALELFSASRRRYRLSCTRRSRPARAFRGREFPAARRQPHGAVGLRLQMALYSCAETTCTHHRPASKKTQPGQQHDRHEAELRVVLFYSFAKSAWAYLRPR